MELLIAITALAGIWFLVVTIPGPNFVMVTRLAMTQSRTAGLATAIGVSVGAGVWATASLLGLSALFAYAGWLYDTIRVVGGLYLVYIGIRTVEMILRGKRDAETPDADEYTRLWFAFRRGLFTSFSNPKTAVFFGSLFLTTFPPQVPAWAFIVTIVTIFIISMIWYSLVACFFSITGIRNAYFRIKPALDCLTGTLLAFLGMRLLISEE